MEVIQLMNKERKIPIRLLQEEALLRRLPKGHPLLPKIGSSVERRKAGHRGEQNIDYHLSFLPQNKYLIFRGLRLIDQHPFQIDTLLLSPRLILSIETKNISGTLTFDKHSEQMIRKYGDTEEGFSNPLRQAERQVIQLRNWLHKHKFPAIPIEYFVTISQSQTILKSNHMNLFEKVIHTEQVVNRIQSIDKRYRTDIIDEKMIRKISRTLIKEDTYASSDILKSWNISPSEIVPGVECPFCHTIPMTRTHGKWCCSVCKEISKDAHIQAIKDYFLLLGKTMSNKQCREFLFISSKRTAEQLLNSMNLTREGVTRGIVYRMKS
jgi:hypothetical protein